VILQRNAGRCTNTSSGLIGRPGTGNFTLGFNSNGAAPGGSRGEELNRDADGVLLYAFRLTVSGTF